MNAPALRAVPALLLLVAAGACGKSAAIAPPPPSGPTLKYASVQAALDRTCALTEDGHAYCWGHGVPSPRGDSIVRALLPAPVAVAFTFRALSLGDFHQCGVASDGKMVCWGGNRHFQFGDLVGADSLRPTPVHGGMTFTAAAAGGEHSCGLVLGNAWCWGLDFFGQLGVGLTATFGSPGLVVGRRQFTAISAGESHTCALTPAGAAYCWGSAVFGQLGGDSLSQRCGWALCSQVPIPVKGGLAFASISAGGDHTCAVTAAGVAYCWGRGDAGQLGTGTTAGSSVPLPVAGNIRFLSLSAGKEHTCGVALDGTAYCWGHNNFGRLGTGGPEAIVPQPAPVAGSRHFVQVSAGTLHTCGLTTDGALYCWGFGGFGQLGHGSPTNEPAPVRVAEPARAS